MKGKCSTAAYLSSVLRVWISAFTIHNGWHIWKMASSES
jgi:hypothetical protein